MHKKLFVIAALLASATTAHAATAHAADTGISLGMRLGYALPMGDVYTGSSLSDGISGNLPIWIDAGYRFTPNISAGLYFQYDMGFTKNCPAGVSCGTHTLHLGLEGFYHFQPKHSFDPYIGIGTGWEWLSGSESANGKSADDSYNGWEFLNLQGGGDFLVSRQFTVGPYVSFSLGKYGSGSQTRNGVSASGDIVNTSMHEWLQLGVRGTFNL